MLVGCCVGGLGKHRTRGRNWIALSSNTFSLSPSSFHHLLLQTPQCITISNNPLIVGLHLHHESCLEHCEFSGSAVLVSMAVSTSGLLSSSLWTISTLEEVSRAGQVGWLCSCFISMSVTCSPLYSWLPSSQVCYGSTLSKHVAHLE